MSQPILDPSIFHEYDIRGVVPDQLNTEGVKKIAAAIVTVFHPSSVQLGHDMRVSSSEFYAAFQQTFIEMGVDVVCLGLVSTDMLYYAAGKYDEDLAITISASHNPSEHNGVKMVKKGAISIGRDSGLADIKNAALEMTDIPISERKGTMTNRNIMDEFVDHVMSFADTNYLGNYKVVVDAGNGMAGQFMPHIEEKLSWQIERLYYELDGTFPNHQPSPIEEKNMQDTITRVKETNADFGMAFDGDADRVFLVDETGRIVSGTLMTAMIAKMLLEKHAGETVLFNAIIGRIVPETIRSAEGKPVRVPVGHSFIKEKMRELNAIFCGEHSGHYYFRDNYYADSAIIAVLLVSELMTKQNKKLSELVDEYDKYFSSGEINFVANNKNELMLKVENRIRDSSDEIDHLDGLSVWFKDWWFNLRPSNTEPYLRLNIETNSLNLLKEKKDYLLQLLKGFGGELKE